MTNKKLEMAMDEIKVHRDEVVDKLLNFSGTDVLLFWGKDEELIEKQEKIWAPILAWAGKEFNTRYCITNDIEVPNQHKNSEDNFKEFVNELSDKELAAFYLASVNTKSEILAAALVKGQISAEQAYSASCLEETWQSEHWGKDEVSECGRELLKSELSDIEIFLKR